jgi:hypothetical protein
MNGKLGALLGATAVAVAMLAIYAPGAQSGANNAPKLKIVGVSDNQSVPNGNAGGPTVRCPVGYHVTGGGFSFTTSANASVVFAGRRDGDPRSYVVTVANATGGSITVSANAICVKGKNGLKISDNGVGILD